jgi:nicotinamidase-related amidase
MKSKILTTLVLAFAGPVFVGAAEPLLLPLRSRAKDNGQVREELKRWDPAKTALVICDMWDTHTCPAAAARVDELAPSVDAVAQALRARGALIIHCPSGTMKFYTDTPQRRLAQAAPAVQPKVPLMRTCPLDLTREALLPIDDSEPCDGPRTWKKGDPVPWTRQNAAIAIVEGDAITDSLEAFYLIRQRGIEHVLICGVHLNMCVLHRPFAIRQFVMQGIEMVLLRDLTDTMYNPAQRPYVSHFEGTRLMVAHVERYWCPSTTSAAILGGQPFRFKGDPAPATAAGDHGR